MCLMLTALLFVTITDASGIEGIIQTVTSLESELGKLRSEMNDTIETYGDVIRELECQISTRDAAFQQLIQETFQIACLRSMNPSECDNAALLEQVIGLSEQLRAKDALIVMLSAKIRGMSQDVFKLRKDNYRYRAYRRIPTLIPKLQIDTEVPEMQRSEHAWKQSANHVIKDPNNADSSMPRKRHFNPREQRVTSHGNAIGPALIYPVEAP